MLLLEELFYHTLLAATTLVENMTSNQGWNEERVQTRKISRGMHQLKEVDMLSAKMDLLMKKLEDRANEKQESCTFMISVCRVKNVATLGI